MHESFPLASCTVKRPLAQPLVCLELEKRPVEQSQYFYVLQLTLAEVAVLPATTSHFNSTHTVVAEDMLAVWSMP